MAKFNFRFRRSVGNRFSRVNFTKTGIGYSAGVPGFRRSEHSTGRKTTTVGIPGTGMSWRKDERTPAEGRETETPPASRYPDPDGTSEYRWWDGDGWTNRVALHGEISEDGLGR